MSPPAPETTPEVDEATAWFARLGNRAVTTDSLREFRAWRAIPANDAAYLEVEAAWSRAGGLADDPQVLRAVDTALARPPARRWTDWLGRPRIVWDLALAGATIAAALTAGQQIWPTYVTGVGEQRIVRLQDGSRVHLNTDSRVRVAFRPGERRLVLSRGEAYFDVAHDAARPFVVDAGGADVRALGTKFDVRRDAGAIRVTLLQGQVRVTRDKVRQAWTLAPNQQLTLAASGATGLALAPKPVDAAGATSWTTGRLVFRQTPLAAAVAEVNRYSDHKVALQPGALGGQLVNGVFDVGDTDSFIRGVTMLFDLKAVPQADGAIRLEPGGAAPPA